MNALVVYDSVHGNTEQVARAMAGALGSSDQVETRKITEVGSGLSLACDLLVVGSPTHAFRPTPAMRDYLKGIPDGGLLSTKVAAFDTRISAEDADSAILSFMVKLFGYAAKPIANALRKKGGELVAAPEGFYVAGTEGPLKEGELERAAAWAEGLREATR